MSTAETVAAIASAFLIGGGSGLLYWRSITRKTRAEGSDVYTQAAERIVKVMETVVARLETRVTALEVDNEVCNANSLALAAEVRRLGGNPALIVSERRRQYRLGPPDTAV